MKSVAFFTLGCKVNQAETAAMRQLFEKAGYSPVDFDSTADVYVINTCTVTNLGDRKSRQAARRARRRNPAAVVVVTGCYAQISPEEVMAIPEVDLVVGTHARESLPRLAEEARNGRFNYVRPLTEKQGFENLPAAQAGERTRAFLKVQEGCRQFCSYCIVPYARGPLYSSPAKATIQEAERLAREGFLEIVLTGVHLGSYGTDLPDKPALSDLLAGLIRVEGIKRIRLSSLEPTEITPALVEVMAAEPKICPHLHIPLQSGDDAVLKRMNRKYAASDFLCLVQWLRSAIPDLALTTDVIVGFPGETGDNFGRTVAVIRHAGFSRLHVFPFSPRRGTPAACFPDQVPSRVKEERSRHLIKLGKELAARFNARFIGQKAEVLFEEEARPGVWAGLTPHYVRVEVTSPLEVRGRLAEVLVTGTSRDFLWGKLL